MSHSFKLLISEFEHGSHPTVASIVRKIDVIMMSGILRTTCTVEAEQRLRGEQEVGVRDVLGKVNVNIGTKVGQMVDLTKGGGGEDGERRQMLERKVKLMEEQIEGLTYNL